MTDRITADLLVDSGQCQLDLGQPERARELIEEGMALLPGARDRRKAVFLTYEAGSYLKAGEPTGPRKPPELLQKGKAIRAQTGRGDHGDGRLVVLAQGLLRTSVAGNVHSVGHS
ncbi:hypothetical protein [Streptomyces sp. NPDC001851]|uniref:hypothetical protein n=1 Tax=Streptomyces sp. NPDC001851 TaxID=3154529 RepID=UPI00333182A0